MFLRYYDLKDDPLSDMTCFDIDIDTVFSFSLFKMVLIIF